MITTTHRLTAMRDIESSILRDIDDRPDFTMTRSQLMNRIINYCDDPAITDIDIDAIYHTMLSYCELPIRD